MKLIGQNNSTDYFLLPQEIILLKARSSVVKPSIDSVRESLELNKKISIERAEPLLLLVQLEGMQRLSKEVRDFLKSEEAKSYDVYIRKSAFVTKSQLSKMLGNFIIGLHKTNYPLRIFSKEEVARNWLLDS
ncbi:hypothetical protein PPO43_02355 [Saprospira sp. CCB-QB6]|uniref:DUF7793 family protein n=1 Tax=Saprospira sp. CCB-QB6 TaxID=3023936 RepID=UPI00234BECC1|nr:STAS/SEC14 domain-containing protein [Saprospira sp. CCB-QB6]WCL81941.1 hypothetical protein PPO43_02355 [Saprospira sp. CCB-QB6]